MAEEFLWEVNWEELPDETPSRTPVPPQAASNSNAVSSAPVLREPVPPPVFAGPAPRISEPSRPVSASIKPGPAVEPSGKRRLIRGERVDVATLGRGDLVLDLAVKLSVPGANLCALGLLENERFAGDEYFVFQDQPATPCGSCRLLPNGREADLHLELASAPARIHRFLIMVYTDAQRGVGTHGPGHFQIRQGPAVLAESSIHAEDLGTAPCAIIAEIYRRNNGWRLGLQLAGTGKSLEALLRSYGAEVQ